MPSKRYLLINTNLRLENTSKPQEIENLVVVVTVGIGLFAGEFEKK